MDLLHWTLNMPIKRRGFKTLQANFNARSKYVSLGTRYFE